MGRYLDLLTISEHRQGENLKNLINPPDPSFLGLLGTPPPNFEKNQAAAELPKPAPFPDDRRTCDQCANLIARRCQAAKRGEIVTSRNYEPIRDLPRRCEGYAPGAGDPDRRHGRERWPGLIKKGGE